MSHTAVAAAVEQYMYGCEHALACLYACSHGGVSDSLWPISAVNDDIDIIV
jgi:hypothetical protein